ncbi:hypothetical protein EJ08DRAFT_382471 [Tothia fuscella]|uniref:Uncharacterized protein n=1 Tax=Tothia fuscella TaxID=1048955 RepID=A0A9P4NKY6_9PEZI|nr:hypothetical protein EJ08DRAFT_382471 [Tothia fuscella]
MVYITHFPSLEATPKLKGMRYNGCTFFGRWWRHNLHSALACFCIISSNASVMTLTKFSVTLLFSFVVLISTSRAFCDFTNETSSRTSDCICQRLALFSLTINVQR